MLLRVSLRTCVHVRCDASRGSSFVLKQLIANNHGQHRRLSSSVISRQSIRTNLFQALSTHDPLSIAVEHSESGRKFTYSDLTSDILAAQKHLIRKCSARGVSSLKGERVAFASSNDYYSVVNLFSILASDAIAVPVLPNLPYLEVKYILDNADAKVLLLTEIGSQAREMGKWFVDGDDLIIDVKGHVPRPGHFELSSQVDFPDVHDAKGGLMLYTSGTTSQPKGVFLPLSALQAQAQSLIEAWKYSPKDRLLHLLPLHHIHGLVNALLVPILAGSTIEFMRAPSAPVAVWNRLAAPFLEQVPGQNPSRAYEKITFFTGVPTLYSRLMAYFPSLPDDVQAAAKRAISPKELRLNISGSAPLPTPTKSAWTELSDGNVLLERYGMTEVGMALSCGLHRKDRVDGSVGWPLPSVEVRLWDMDKQEVIQPGEEIEKETGRERLGEIQLRGPTIFRKYWNNPKATEEAFVADDDGKGKWFRTGDVAVRRIVNGSGQSAEISGKWAQGPIYFIQGRLSVDIIKTGGEKVSALEVERELLSLPEIAEAAVVGLPSETWGQRVAAVIVLKEQNTAPQGVTNGGETSSGSIYKPWGALHLRRILGDRLAAYKLPQEVKVLTGNIPRNKMGKVNKKALAKEIFGVQG